jgi:hypothetical protein
VFFAVAKQGCCSYRTSKNLTAAYLRNCLLKVIAMLQSAGYLIIYLISDNNRVNRNMFTEICSGSLMPYVHHPCSAGRKQFFLFNSVHLLNCMRNNWLGQSDTDNTFLFPDMFSDNVSKASMSYSRKLYEIEKDSLVEMALGLTTRVLYPSNIERQNVMFVLRVFDEKMIARLQHYGAQNNIDVASTVNFFNQFWGFGKS